VLATDVVVLHQDETLGSVVIVTEWDVAPLDRHEFSGSQPGVGANFQSSLQEPRGGRRAGGLGGAGC